MKKLKRSRDWDTFLRVPGPSTTNLASMDAGWLSQHGAHWTSPIVIGLLRDEVLPLVRSLERSNSNLMSYFFLVHDYQSGVPVSAMDKASYIHLRLKFEEPTLYVQKSETSAWEMTRPIIDDGESPSGVEDTLFRAGYDRPAQIVLWQQSKWVLDVLEMHKQTADTGQMVLQMRQFLHYFSNMTQMRVA